MFYFCLIAFTVPTKLAALYDLIGSARLIGLDRESEYHAPMCLRRGAFAGYSIVH